MSEYFWRILEAGIFHHNNGQCLMVHTTAGGMGVMKLVTGWLKVRTD